METSAAPDGAKLQLSLFYSMINDMFEAKKFVDEVKDAYSDKYLNKWSVKGWTKLLDEEESEEFFEKALQQNPKEIDAQMGMAKHYEKIGDFKNAVEVLNKLIVNSPNYTPVLVEKMRLLLILGGWEQSVETANRILTQKDEKNIDALAQVRK
jgi:tetratricopeptide (TPR) repeat protein